MNLIKLILVLYQVPLILGVFQEVLQLIGKSMGQVQILQLIGKLKVYIYFLYLALLMDVLDQPNL